MRRVGHYAEVAVPHSMERPQVLKYFVPLVLDRAADLYCIVPVLRVGYRFLMRLREMALNAR